MSIWIWIVICIFCFIMGCWVGESAEYTPTRISYQVHNEMMMIQNFNNFMDKVIRIFKFLLDNIEGDKNKTLIKSCIDHLLREDIDKITKL